MLQADTIIPDGPVSQSLNRYSYVFNNPLSYTDPTGHSPKDDDDNDTNDDGSGDDAAEDEEDDSDDPLIIEADNWVEYYSLKKLLSNTPGVNLITGVAAAAIFVASTQVGNGGNAQSNTLTTSADGLTFIQSLEGTSLTLYNDVGNNAHIGIGHLVHLGPIDGTESQDFINGITNQEALDLLAADVVSFENVVNNNVTITLSQTQLDALVSFSFNIGAGAFRTSTLLQEINSGTSTNASITNAFNLFNQVRVNGQLQFSQGLANRRTAEIDLYNNGNY